jgi:hypothetical protein
VSNLLFPGARQAVPVKRRRTDRKTSVLSQVAWRTRKRSGFAGSRSTTWVGVQAHGQTLMPGVRENWICPRVHSTATRGQDSAMRARSGPWERSMSARTATVS